MSSLIDRMKALPARAVAMPKNIKLFLFSVLVYGMAVEGISAVLLNLYLLRLGYGTEFIGTLNSAGLFVFALVSLPIGAVQNISSRKMLMIGLVFSMVGLIGLPLAQYADSWQAALLIGFRIMSMIGLSCYFVHQVPFAMEITKPVWHSRILSLTMATFSLAAFFGSWVGGLLPEWFSVWLALPLTDPRPFQLPMFVATAVVVPGLISVWMISEAAADDSSEAEKAEANSAVLKSAESRSSSHSRFGNWRAIIGLVTLIIVIRALQTSSVGIVNTFSNVYFDDFLNVPTNRIGLISGIGRLLGVPLSLTIPWLVGRYGNFRLVLISLGLIAVLLIPMAFIPSWQIAAVALIAINSMGSLRYLSFISFTMSLVTEKQRSLISGAGEMAIGVGFAASSFVGGYLISWYGYRELFLFGAAVTTIGTLAFWLIFRNRAATIPTDPVPAG
ncbi:MAG: MFS transporter [Anaerolineae bacterium]